MHWLVGTLGGLIVLVVLWDGFETMVLPRRVTRRFRLTREFYRVSWKIWSQARRLRGRRREAFLSWFGPLSLLLLLIVWALAMILGFAMAHWSLGPALTVGSSPADFWIDLYASGTTFSTLGLGDVTPQSAAARFLMVVEAGTGFGFLAIVIGYLPALYQSFSRREVPISLLDARAGSPSTPSELLRRHARAGGLDDLDGLFREWERWAAELLEGHISHPLLCYFRSQHDNQSWLGSLTTILDTCAIVIAGVDGVRPWQAQLTFAMARHAAVDMAQVFSTPPRAPKPDRLGADGPAQLRVMLAAAGLRIDGEDGFDHRLAELRKMYEPYVYSLAAYLLLKVPEWFPSAPVVDNWRTSAWERRSTGLPPSIFDGLDEEHL